MAVCNTIGWTWTGWPSKPLITLYGEDGRYLKHSKSKKFDLADAIAPLLTDRSLLLHITIRSRDDSTEKRWTSSSVNQQKENIHYDLSEDGYLASVKLLAGLGAPCDSDLFFEVKIQASYDD